MKRFIRFIQLLEDFTLLVRDVFRSFSVVHRYLRESIEEMYLIGAQSFPLVAIGGLFMGIILSLEVGHRFETFGAKTLVGRTVALGMIRELGPVVSGLLLAARVGAKNASELGSMKLSEQIDALRAFGSNPVHTLVLPRTVACLIMFLPLVLIADATGLCGGLIVAQSSLEYRSILLLENCHRWFADERSFCGMCETCSFRIFYRHYQLLLRFEDIRRNDRFRAFDHRCSCFLIVSRSVVRFYFHQSRLGNYVNERHRSSTCFSFFQRSHNFDEHQFVCRTRNNVGHSRSQRRGKKFSVENYSGIMAANIRQCFY